MAEERLGTEEWGRNELLSRDQQRDLHRRSNLPGFARLSSHLVLLSLTTLAVYLSAGSLLRIPAIVCHGFMLGALLAPLHECAHRTAFRSKRLNEIVGAICGFIILNPVGMYRAYHFMHHRYTSVPGRDPEFNVHPPRTVRQYLVFISGWAELHRCGRVVVNSARSVAGSLSWMLELRILFAGLVLLVAGAIYFQTLAPLYYWLIPLMIGTVLIADIQATEHTGCPIVPDQLRNTRTTITNPVNRFLLWNLSYHAEHHAFPSVPFHALPRLHRLMEGKFEVVEPGYLRFHRKLLADVLHADPRQPIASP